VFVQGGVRVGSIAALVAAKGAALGGAFLFVMLVWLVIAAALGYWGMKVLAKKGHPAWLGFVLGFFLELIGIIICYVLPAKTAAKPMASTGMPMAPPPMGGMAPPPAAPMATPPAAAPTPPPPAPPAPPTPPAPGV